MGKVGRGTIGVRRNWGEGRGFVRFKFSTVMEGS